MAVPGKDNLSDEQKKAITDKIEQAKSLQLETKNEEEKEEILNDLRRSTLQKPQVESVMTSFYDFTFLKLSTSPKTTRISSSSSFSLALGMYL